MNGPDGSNPARRRRTDGDASPSTRSTRPGSASRNESRDLGGACYGDSGGPNFVTIDGKLVLAGTTITGDTPCYATNVA